MNTTTRTELGDARSGPISQGDQLTLQKSSPPAPGRAVLRTMLPLDAFAAAP